jgi:enoyl-CoA hydratase/carnithine racemase
MSHVIRTEHSNGVIQLSLNNGGGNALSSPVLEDLYNALSNLDGARALVLDGGSAKLFSGGFDLTEIVGYEREQLASFFGRFMQILDRILRLDCPSVIAIHSHALAGGFILSLAFDLRVVATRELKLGLNEVDLGVMIPASTEALFGLRTSPQIALSYGMSGRLFGPEEAARIGYADLLADDPQAQALTVADTLAKKPGGGVTLTRRRAGDRIADIVDAQEREHREAFLDSWHSPEAQAGLRAVAERLRKR